MSGPMERNRPMNRYSLVRIGLPVALMASGALAMAGGTAVASTAPAARATTALLTARPAIAPRLAPQAGSVSVKLCAKSGNTTLPDGVTLTVWGYVQVATDCSDAGALTAPGGPVISANEGDSVAVTLYNGLSETTGLFIQGQSMLPDLAGVPAGGSKTYSFVAKAGTTGYEAAVLPNAQHQTAMGLAGALVVQSAVLGQAYAGPATAFDNESVVVLSEIDPALNTSVNREAFDMRNFRATYGLINGKAGKDVAVMAASAGTRHLLRIVNAGLQPHSLGSLGVRQTIIANDGSEARFPHTIVAETLGSGQSADAVVNIPAGAAGSKFALYDASMTLHHAGAAVTGGMIAFLSVAAVGTPSGPITTAVSLTPNPTDSNTTMVALAAQVAPAPDQVRYYIESLSSPPCTSGVDVTDLAVSGTGAVTAQVTTISGASPCGLVSLAAGAHPFYVQGHNVNGWGPAAAGTLNVVAADTVGPATSGLAVTPAVTRAANIALTATIDDAATGAAPITEAEFVVVQSPVPISPPPPASPVQPVPPAPGTPGTPMTGLSPAGAMTVSASGTVPFAALTEGGNTLWVRGRDQHGNWGAYGYIGVTRDTVGPVTSSLTAVPNPTNGVIGVDATTAAVRVRATVADALSNVVAVEGFIDPVGTPTTASGFVFLPSDGTWNSPTEAVYSDIPLATIRALSNGTHTIGLRGRDQGGNWTSVLVTTTILVDKQAPVSAITAPGLGFATNTIGQTNQTFTLTATAAEPSPSPSGVVAMEWYQNPAPAPGSGTPMTLSTSVPVATYSNAIDFVALGWVPGNHTVFVRSKDAAGNWSLPVSRVVNVVYPNIFFNGFDSLTTATLSPTWVVGGTAGRVAVVNAGAQGGSARRLDVTVATVAGITTSGFVQDNKPTNEAAYRARLWVNPNGLTTGAGAGAAPGSAANPRVVTLFRGLSLDGAGTTVFELQYRRSTTTNYQVRLSAAGSPGSVNSNWVTIANGNFTNVEMTWQSGLAATPSLSTAGVIRQTLAPMNTSANTLGSVQIGVQALAGDVLTGISGGPIRFDTFFSSKGTPFL